MGKKYRSKWDHIIACAADIANSYDTPVTLGQLFYRLIAALLFTNTDGNYTYDREHLALLADIAERFTTDQLRAMAEGWADQ
jgi:hypothetical protein